MRLMRASLLLVVGATAVAGWVLPRASPRTRARARSRDGESRTPFGSLRRAVQNATTWEFVPPWQFIGGAAAAQACIYKDMHVTQREKSRQVLSGGDIRRLSLVDEIEEEWRIVERSMTQQ